MDCLLFLGQGLDTTLTPIGIASAQLARNAPTNTQNGMNSSQTGNQTNKKGAPQSKELAKAPKNAQTPEQNRLSQRQTAKD